MRQICLNAGWKMHEAPLDCGRDQLSAVLALADGWLDANVPADIHMPLIAAGRIPDVSVGEGCFASEWTENRSWWFVKRFTPDAEDLAADAVELTFESLDAHADIFFNGAWLGESRSAFVPFTADVKNRLTAGDNTLAVRLTSGLETVTDEDIAEINGACCHERDNGRPERGDLRRPMVRRPQYSVGWDWGPRVVTTGIVKSVWLRAYRKVKLSGLHAHTQSVAPGEARLRVSLEADQLHPWATLEADIRVCLSFGGVDVACAGVTGALFTSGLNYFDFELTVKNPRLWWPNGSGKQPLYALRAECNVGGAHMDAITCRVGLRTLRLDTARDERGRAFRVIVNGVPVFMKGGNWIPADSIYARVTDEKYRRLVFEAREANFNMLRVWGGGLYERDAFYDACDDAGILLWHDFMLACAAYPENRADFRALFESEMDAQTRALRNHACLALFCGNNENHWIFNPEANSRVANGFSRARQFGLGLSNRISAAWVRRNCPEIPYWNSSPYGGAQPNAPDAGDAHCWHEWMMNPDMRLRIEPREYDRARARFVSEYGYPGPCVRESTREYLGCEAETREGRAWETHTNTFEKQTVAAGIEKHYRDGANALSLDEYLLYAGLTQGLMLGYSLEALRFDALNGGALMWMYNDTWGEVGWSIVDYSLRRKIAYYFVKRALAPVRLILREKDGFAVLHAANDTAETVRLPRARAGYLSFDGGADQTRETPLALFPRSRTELFRLPLPPGDYRRGAFVVRAGDSRAEDAVLRMGDLRTLALPKAAPRVLAMADDGPNLRVTLCADAFLHGVHANGAHKASDMYFDMLPGARKTVLLFGAAGERPAFEAVCL